MNCSEIVELGLIINGYVDHVSFKFDDSHFSVEVLACEPAMKILESGVRILGCAAIGHHSCDELDTSLLGCTVFIQEIPDFSTVQSL